MMSANAPAAYEGTVNIAGGDGGATRSGAPGTIWFIEPPPAGSMLLLR